MRIIVTGGRDFSDRAQLYAVLDQLNERYKIEQLVEGGALGADRLARDWAHERGIPIITCPADWAKNGRAAGMIRNVEMLTSFPKHILVAFPGGRGTIGMIQEAQKRGRRMFRFEYRKQ